MDIFSNFVEIQKLKKKLREMSSKKIKLQDLDESVIALITEKCVVKNDNTGEYFRFGIDNNGMFSVPYALDIEIVEEGDNNA